MAVIGAVTDDFTGAASAGMMMAKARVKTGLFFDSDMVMQTQEARELEAIYVSSNSRPLPPQEAYAKVKDATEVLKKCGVKYFSKKIDTTLRGGIGCEVDAMLDSLGENTVAVMVTAMPPSRRICIGGYSVIDSVILNETSVANDVKTPVKECYVPRIIGPQTKRKMDLITIDVVQKGIPVLRDALRDSRNEGNEIIIVDAVSMEHIDFIAKACVELSWNVLAVDPGPFTMKLAAARGIADDTAPRQEDKMAASGDKTVLIVAGSANPSTKQQMDILFEREHSARRISVSPSRLLEDSKEHELEVARSIKQLNNILSGEAPPKVILVETALHGEVLNLKEEDEKHGYAQGGSSRRINTGLAEIANAVLKAHDSKIAGMMLTGGDTMESVCRMIGTTYIQAVDNIVAQVDVGRLAGAYAGMPIVVKGGFCGYDEVGVDIVKRILTEANL